MLHRSEVVIQRTPQEGFPLNVALRVSVAPESLLTALYVRDRCGLTPAVRWPALPDAVPPVLPTSSPAADLRVLSIQWERWWVLLWSGEDVLTADALRSYGFDELAAKTEHCQPESDAWVAATRAEMVASVKAKRQADRSPQGLHPERIDQLRAAFEGARSATPLTGTIDLTVLPVAGTALVWLTASTVIVPATLFLDAAAMRQALSAAFRPL